MLDFILNLIETKKFLPGAGMSNGFSLDKWSVKLLFSRFLIPHCTVNGFFELTLAFNEMLIR